MFEIISLTSITYTTIINIAKVSCKILNHSGFCEKPLCCLLQREKFPLDKNVLQTRGSQLPIHKVCVSVPLKFEEDNCAFPLKLPAFQLNKHTTAEICRVFIPPDT